MRRYTLSLLLCLCVVVTALAQAPPGYCSSASGLSGSALQNALYNIIKNHTVVPYTSLYSVYDSSDLKANTQIWDMYSDVPGGTPAYVYYNTPSDRCGTYTQEGDCFNREHSWPQSWFNSVSPPQSDAFHIFPTDGWVNNQRSNYPYGEVSNPAWTSTNGSRLGPNTTIGYNSTVFEPIDAYKGDVARGYFYMATRYLGEDGSWGSSPATNGATILPWQLCLLIDWHHQDTVSTKEINRNNAIYKWQNNRNPYIDHPEWVDSVFACTLVGIQGHDDLVSAAVYPNPGSAQVTIEWEGLNAHAAAEFYNVMGELVLTHTLKHGRHTVDVRSLARGLYTLVLRSGDQASFRKIVLH